MLIPFKGSFQSPFQRIYNYILVARFGILQPAINGSEELGDAIILATAAIHNWPLQIEEDWPSGERIYCPRAYTDRYRADGSVVRGEWRNEYPELEDARFESLQSAVMEADPARNKTMDGELVALRFAKYFIENDIPWQWKMTHVMQ